MKKGLPSLEKLCYEDGVDERTVAAVRSHRLIPVSDLGISIGGHSVKRFKCIECGITINRYNQKWVSSLADSTPIVSCSEAKMEGALG